MQLRSDVRDFPTSETSQGLWFGQLPVDLDNSRSLITTLSDWFSDSSRYSEFQSGAIGSFHW